MELERSADFKQVELGASVLRLIPSDNMREGERLRLTLSFEDGAAPSKATFVLVVRREQADRLVEILRQPRPLESCQQEMREAWDALRQCQATLAGAQVAPGALTGLTALVASRGLDGHGVMTRDLKVGTQGRGNAFVVSQLRTFRAARRVLVELSPQASLSGEPWTARDAALTDGRGEALKVLSLWQESPVTASKPGWVLVEAEVDDLRPPGPWTLRLTDEGDGRALVLDGITFAPYVQPGGGE